MPDTDGIENEEWIERTRKRIRNNTLNTQYAEEVE